MAVTQLLEIPLSGRRLAPAGRRQLRLAAREAGRAMEHPTHRLEKLVRRFHWVEASGSSFVEWVPPRAVHTAEPEGPEERRMSSWPTLREGSSACEWSEAD